MPWCLALAVVELMVESMPKDKTACRGVVRTRIQDAVKCVWSSPVWWFKRPGYEIRSGVSLQLATLSNNRED